MRNKLRKGIRMKHKPTKKWEYYSIADGKVERKRKSCPRCGEGFFMAEHKEKDGSIRYSLLYTSPSPRD